MKRFYPIAGLACLGGLMAMAADFEVNNISYGISSQEDLTVYVASPASSYSGELVIPETIEVNDTVWTVVEVGDFALWQQSDVTSIQLPQTITRLGDAAFGQATGLTAISIPAGVRYIGNACFNGCSSLGTVEMPDSLDFLGMAAFAYSGITSAVLPGGITELPGQLFEQCENLESVVVPEGVTTIQFQAFQKTSSLKTATLPSSLESIGVNCFAFSGLTSMQIPANFESYGDNALTMMTSLTEYAVDPANEHFTAVDGVLYSKDMSVLHSFPLACGLTSYAVNQATTHVADYSFYGTALDSIQFPEDLVTVGKSAFATANNLTKVSIPDKVETMGAYSFWGCENLKEISLGGSLTSIGSGAFSYTSGLEKVTSRNMVPPAGAAFTAEVYSNATLYVPEAVVGDYSEAAGWSDFMKIEAIQDSGVADMISDEISVSLEGNVLTVMCEENTLVAVINMTGTTHYAGSGPSEITLSSGQPYIIKIGTRAKKIFVK